MTSKFSIDNRELLQRISSGEAVVGIDFGNLIVRELAAFRLAAMDSEPDCKERKLFCSTDTTRMRKIISVSAGTEDAPLYRHAQPVPVVPEEKSIPNTLSMYAVDAVAAIAEVKGWNACRAAMLQELQKNAGAEAICRSNENVQVLHTYSPAQSDCRPAQNHVSPEQNGDTPAQSQGWIPVSERMPIEFEAVIAFDGDQVYGEAMYSSDDGFTIDGYEPCDRLNLQNVTHWMPLPPAPQEVR
ncbi:hypothetical protein nublan006_36170 [Klebsiella pneumoniae]|nr:DUF551 domain-containing protein [Klebsiella pneumoniae]HBR7583174.1 DUF551 domain-containing protein [Klebsiella pneumoniae]HBX5022819.1 DUF551 domain-containing protein [Klebsiella pneumoniae]HBX5025047.1 DUF551 domain-containing protein [Klebsiella pneumoniae]HBX7984408.1 DUF551 domain-containing protein [Klebsiella pneumoniae]